MANAPSPRSRQPGVNYVLTWLPSGRMRKTLEAAHFLGSDKKLAAALTFQAEVAQSISGIAPVLSQSPEGTARPWYETNPVTGDLATDTYIDSGIEEERVLLWLLNPLVETLLALKRQRGRTHGQLRCAAILIDGSLQQSEPSPCWLTDFSIAKPSSKRDADGRVECELADLHGLGGLLHQWVTGDQPTTTLPTEIQEYKINDDEFDGYWKKLNNGPKFWRPLATALANGAYNGTPITLESLQRCLKQRSFSALEGAAAATTLLPFEIAAKNQRPAPTNAPEAQAAADDSAIAAERLKKEHEDRVRRERQQAERLAEEQRKAADRARLEAERLKKEQEETAQREQQRKQQEQIRREQEEKEQRERQQAERLAEEQRKAADRARLEAERLKKEQEETAQRERLESERRAAEQRAADPARLETERLKKAEEERLRRKQQKERQEQILKGQQEEEEREREQAERKKKLVRLVSVAALLLILAGGGGWWWTHRPAPTIPPPVLTLTVPPGPYILGDSGFPDPSVKIEGRHDQLVWTFGQETNPVPADGTLPLKERLKTPGSFPFSVIASYKGTNRVETPGSVTFLTNAPPQGLTVKANNSINPPGPLEWGGTYMFTANATDTTTASGKDLEYEWSFNGEPPLRGKQQQLVIPLNVKEFTGQVTVKDGIPGGTVTNKFKFDAEESKTSRDEKLAQDQDRKARDTVAKAIKAGKFEEAWNLLSQTPQPWAKAEIGKLKQPPDNATPIKTNLVAGAQDSGTLKVANTSGVAWNLTKSDSSRFEIDSKGVWQFRAPDETAVSAKGNQPWVENATVRLNPPPWLAAEAQPQTVEFGFTVSLSPQQRDKIANAAKEDQSKKDLEEAEDWAVKGNVDKAMEFARKVIPPNAASLISALTTPPTLSPLRGPVAEIVIQGTNVSGSLKIEPDAKLAKATWSIVPAPSPNSDFQPTINKHDLKWTFHGKTPGTNVVTFQVSCGTATSAPVTLQFVVGSPPRFGTTKWEAEITSPSKWTFDVPVDGDDSLTAPAQFTVENRKLRLKTPPKSRSEIDQFPKSVQLMADNRFGTARQDLTLRFPEAEPAAPITAVELKWVSQDQAGSNWPAGNWPTAAGELPANPGAFVGKTEVSWGQLKKVLGNEPTSSEWWSAINNPQLATGLGLKEPPDNPASDDYPAGGVPPAIALKFCDKLNGNPGLPPNWEYRLPSHEELLDLWRSENTKKSQGTEQKARKISEGDSSASGLFHLAGNMREWTDTGSAFGKIADGANVSQSNFSPRKLVEETLNENLPSGATASDRIISFLKAGANDTTASPLILRTGFRVVLAPKN